MSLFARGDRRARRNANDRAIGDLDEAIRLDPTVSRYFLRRADLWFGKDLDRALADYNEAIRLDPKSSEAHSHRARISFERGDYEKAIADQTEAIRLDPKNTFAYASRGFTLGRTGRYDAALDDYQEALRIDPNCHWAFDGQAWLWATCPEARYRDGKKAVEAASRACHSVGRDDPMYLDTLAAAHAEAGDFSAAVACEEKALKNLSRDSKDRGRFQERLRLYRDKKPYRSTPGSS